MKLETVKIKDGKDFRWINKEDYNPEIHQFIESEADHQKIMQITKNNESSKKEDETPLSKKGGRKSKLKKA